MKHQNFFNTILVTNLVIALLTGCGAPATQVFTPMPPIQAEPIATPTSDSWTDDFNGALAAGWNWTNEDPTHWSLKNTPGALRIITQGQSLYTVDKPKNLLLRDAPASDFEIMTKVTFDPRDNFQQAGILIYQDENNIVLLSRGFCGVRGCPGSGIFLDNLIKGKLDFGNHPQIPASSQTTWLKLRKEGIQYLGFYSVDGQRWENLGRVENPMTPAKVGLTANNSNTDPYDRQIPADFDSVTMQSIILGE